MRYLLGDYTTDGGPGLVVAGPDGLATPAPAVNPSWVATGGPDGTVYTVTETEPGFAAAWRLGETFVPREVGTAQATGGANPCHAAVHPSGEWLLVANYGNAAGGGSVAVLPIGPDGSLDAPSDVFPLVGTGPDPDRQAGPHAHQIVCRSGRVLVVDLGSDRVHVFRLNAAGELEADGFTAFEPGFGPRHLAFVGDRAVIAGELANAVVIGSFDASSGTFELGPRLPLPGTDPADLAALPDIGLPEDVPRPYPGAVVPDEERGLAYVTVRGTDQVAVIDPAAPALIRSVPAGASWPRDATLRSDGKLLVACQFGGVVTLVDPTGGEVPVTAWDCLGVSCVTPLT
ncbi:lactonase family protein [Glycomyces sp. L485]|uniref:lactonase family protein n=1 Tax=Glycomyces sp. L485 TaxID=2909235 RepID=UPI001F4B2CFF|nr:beta-propeller fold lactonase family protein [Glycomyces sp. L485]MCH7230354.1 lactonase family protein [Glycomyces sp. L485]